MDSLIYINAILFFGALLAFYFVLKRKEGMPRDKDKLIVAIILSLLSVSLLLVIVQ